MINSKPYSPVISGPTPWDNGLAFSPQPAMLLGAPQGMQGYNGNQQSDLATLFMMFERQMEEMQAAPHGNLYPPLSQSNGSSAAPQMHLYAPRRTASPTPTAAPVRQQPTQQVPAASASASTATLALPPRDQNALTGSQFMEQTRHMNRTDREAFILKEIQKGNVPEFARHMKDVSVTSTGADGQHHNGTVHVMPDYLAIGSDRDFVRIPMDPKTAQKIADQTGTSLPTTKLVDDVYHQAEVKLKPQPLQAGPQMMSNEYTERHNALVDQQMQSRGATDGELTAGHQKDLVISNRLTQNPGKVAIYGWHQPDGKPIQSLSTVHENTYADYSHGVRLVSGTMMVDGVERPLADVLRDPNLAGLVSNEGAIRNPRVPG